MREHPYHHCCDTRCRFCGAASSHGVVLRRLFVKLVPRRVPGPGRPQESQLIHARPARGRDRHEEVRRFGPPIVWRKNTRKRLAVGLDLPRRHRCHCPRENKDEAIRLTHRSLVAVVAVVSSGSSASRRAGTAPQGRRSALTAPTAQHHEAGRPPHPCHPSQMLTTGRISAHTALRNVAPMQH